MLLNDTELYKIESSEKLNKGVASNSLDNIGNNSNTEGNSELTAIRGTECIKLKGKIAPCPSSKFILVGNKNEKSLFPHLNIFCKKYTCEYCGNLRVFQIKKAIENAINDFSLNVFATLTLNPKSCTPANSARYIRKIWNKFRIIQKRQFNRNLNFICVIENQKSGYAHLHILFDQFINHNWLKEKWEVLGGGSIVDIRKADNKAARYISKYLGKSMRENRDQRIRHISTSKGIKLSKYIKRIPENKFTFAKVEQSDARYILGPYIEENVLDKKNFIKGFLATRRLQVSDQRNVRNVETEAQNV